MYCKVCGASLAPGDVFCKNCGASNNINNNQPVAPTVEPVPPMANQPAPQPVMNQVPPMANQPAPQPVMNQVPPMMNQPTPQMNPNMQAPAPQKGSGKGLLIIGIVVAVLAAAVIGYLIYSSLNKKNENPTGPSVVVSPETQVTYDGYTYSIPQDYVVNVRENGIDLKNSTLEAFIYGFTSGVFKANAKEIFKQYFTSQGMIVNNVTETTILNKKAIVLELVISGSKHTLAMVENNLEVMQIEYLVPNGYATNDQIAEIVDICLKAKKSSTSFMEEENHESEMAKYIEEALAAEEVATEEANTENVEQPAA